MRAGQHLISKSHDKHASPPWPQFKGEPCSRHQLTEQIGQATRSCKGMSQSSTVGHQGPQTPGQCHKKGNYSLFLF